MTRLTVAALVLGTSIVSSTCSQDSVAAPSLPTPAPTRIIRLSGNLAFGNVNVGEVRTDGILVINNDGNAVMTVTALSGPSGSAGVYAATWTSGTISAGAAQNVGIHFSPAAAQNYSGLVTVTADHSSGTNTIAIVASGVAVSGPGPTPTPTPTCSYGLSPSALTLGATGSFTKGTIQVTTTSACAWTVSSADSWLTASPISGAGSGSIAVEATGNVTTSGASRTTRLSVGTATTTVTQTGQSAPTPAPTPSTRTRIGATCNDGTSSTATGSGACSSHGGVRCWRYNDGSCTNP